MLFPGSRHSFALSLPPDFTWVGPAACECCKRLQVVDLSRTDIVEILGSTFAHCSQLQTLNLSSKLRRIEQEAFLHCVSLREVYIPVTMLYIARRAFAGCTQLRTFSKAGKARLGGGHTLESMLLTNATFWKSLRGFASCRHCEKGLFLGQPGTATTDFLWQESVLLTVMMSPWLKAAFPLTATRCSGHVVTF